MLKTTYDELESCEAAEMKAENQKIISSPSCQSWKVVKMEFSVFSWVSRFEMLKIWFGFYFPFPLFASLFTVNCSDKFRIQLRFQFSLHESSGLISTTCFAIFCINKCDEGRQKEMKLQASVATGVLANFVTIQLRESELKMNKLYAKVYETRHSSVTSPAALQQHVSLFGWGNELWLWIQESCTEYEILE